MKNRIYLLAILLFVISFSLSAQLPEKALEIPIKYINPEDDISLSSDTRTRPGSIWVVWSDRNDNTTYAGPSLGQQKKRINFMEPFYVAAETEDMVQLVKDEHYSEKFSSSAEDYGWIEKTKVLLWDHCLVTKQSKINIKGLILNVAGSIFNKSLSQEPIQKTSRVHEVLYVYKITDNAVLLGKPYATDYHKAKSDILGWVDRKKITIWDHRIALEPNWEPSAVDERKSRNLSNLFLIDENRARHYAETGDVAEKFVVWEQSPAISKRRKGDWMRFPLLAMDKRSGIVKAMVMESSNDELSQSGLPAYSAMQIEGLKYPIYKQVLFFTKWELGKMLDQFDNLADAYAASSKRQRLKELWLEILQIHFGNDYSREKAEQLTFKQINEILFGLPGTSDLLNYNLRDLTDPSVVTDTKFYTYVTDIKNKRNELNKIYNDNDYEFGFYSYDEHYFWISQDLLP